MEKLYFPIISQRQGMKWNLKSLKNLIMPLLLYYWYQLFITRMTKYPHIIQINEIIPSNNVPTSGNNTKIDPNVNPIIKNIVLI